MSLYKWMLTYFSQSFVFLQVDSASQPAVETAISLYIGKSQFLQCLLLDAVFLFNYTVCLIVYAFNNSK